MKPETVIREETIFEGKIVDFSLRQVQLHNGATTSREVVINKGAVVIIPITQNNEVRLVKQYRAAAEKWVIELPAGGLEPGEEPDLAAHVNYSKRPATGPPIGTNYMAFTLRPVS